MINKSGFVQDRKNNLPLYANTLLQSGIDRLKCAKIEEPHLESRLYLAHLLHMSQTDLLANDQIRITHEVHQAFEHFIFKRSQHVPFQYLLGYVEFYGRKFQVNEHVLIPRPETEMLVQGLLESDLNAPLHIVDIGTGSGAIAITLAHEMPNALLYATDISEESLNVAIINAQNHRVDERIHFLAGDLFLPLESMQLNDTIDVIISNPPYISEMERTRLPKNVMYEPEIALFSGKDGLDTIRRIIRHAPVFLSHNGTLILEIGATQAQDVMKMIHQNNSFVDTEITCDIAGHERRVTTRCRKKQHF